MSYTSKFTGSQIDELLDASSAMRTSKEDASNKVANFDNPNDSTFPTTKAVWDMVSNQFWYGVEWDKTISSPTCTRIGNMEFHRTLPVQSQMRGCLLADDGTVNKYLNPDDWTGEVRDGSQGMVMVELPRYFRKFETEGNKLRVKLSLLPLDGFHEVKKKYVSAYEAAIERSSGKLCSVVNEGTDYRGGANDSAWDGTYKSQLGMPVSNMSITNARAAARKRGSVNWNCYTYDVLKDIYWLYVCEYATLNCHKEYTEELTIEGYRQGGLGDGLSNINDWDGYNSKRPIAKCGITDYAGNKTTQLPLHLENDDATIEENVYVSRYRGIENLFGHLWKSVDGVILRVSPSEANGGDGTSKVYVCENPKYFNNSDISLYNYIANESRMQTYVKRIAFGERGDIVPTICENVGANSFYSSYHFTQSNVSNISNRGWIAGGVATGKLLNSFIFIYSSYTHGEILIHEGSRLCYKPTENFE